MYLNNNKKNPNIFQYVSPAGPKTTHVRQTHNNYEFESLCCKLHVKHKSGLVTQKI